MTAATVLIPTHNHVAALRHAVASAQQQSLQDFELFIVGDGVGDATRAIVSELSAADRRINFFDFPKGPRKGEIHRHQALQRAQGRFVAYLGDDDIWMPNHLEVLDALLRDADFGHTMQVGIDAQGRIAVRAADLQNAAFRNRMLTEHFNRFDLTFAGHTLAAYRRLPHGWRTTPPEFPCTDLYMWRQFLAEPWCRARSAMIPTGINTWTYRRPHLSDHERADDLAHWRDQAATPAFREDLWRKIAERFATESVAFEHDCLRYAAENARLEAERSALAAHLAAIKNSTSGEHDPRRCAAEITRLEAERSALSAHLAAMKNSTSWRVTWPLRRIRHLVARIGGPKRSDPTHS